MNKHLLRLSGLSALVLLLQSSGFAQSADGKPNKKDTTVNNLRGYDEIIIKRKSDKDAKVTIEIKNGEVFIDGKPAADFQDDDLSVKKRKIRVMDGRTFSYTGPDGDGDVFVAPGAPGEPGEPGMPSPFRSRGGTWNYDAMPKKTINQAFLGVTSEKTPEGDGAKITDVADSSAAAKAGLKKGDVITGVDEISVDNPEELSDAVHKYKPQDKVTITFSRDGKKQQVTATLGKPRKMKTLAYGYSMPDMKGWEGPDLKEFMVPGFDGKGFREFGYSGKARLGIKAQDTEDGKGVKVLDVDEESAAAKAGIKEGDIITRFDGKEVSSASELSQAAQASKSKPSVHVNLLRGGKALDLEIKTPKKLRTADL
jgi:serine protease Do